MTADITPENVMADDLNEWKRLAIAGELTARLLTIVEAERDALSAQLAEVSCPLGMDQKREPSLCGAGTCFDCMVRRLAEVEAERDEYRDAFNADNADLAAALLRAEAAEARESKLQMLVRRVLIDPHWRGNDNRLWPDLCDALQENKP